MVKLLHFDGDGFAIYNKRLETSVYIGDSGPAIIGLFFYFSQRFP